MQRKDSSLEIGGLLSFGQIVWIQLHQNYIFADFANPLPGDDNAAFFAADHMHGFPFAGHNNGFHKTGADVEFNIHNLAQLSAVQGVYHILGAQIRQAHARPPLQEGVYAAAGS